MAGPSSGGPPVFIPNIIPGLGYGGAGFYASGQIRCAGVQAGDSVEINGITLTASGSQTGSGDFDETLAGDNLVALSLAAAINNSFNGLTGTVEATVASGSDTVVVRATTKGVAGNAITLTSSTALRLPVTGSGTLSGGSDGTAAYGFSPYGSAPLPRPPYPPGGGYGGASYGYSPYGSIGTAFPRVTGATSIDGFTIEVFFSEEMTFDATFCDPANYVFTDILGVPVTAVSVDAGVLGPNDGATSALVTHTGTTLGGQYQVEVFNVTDLNGNPIDAMPDNTAQFLAFGSTPTFTAAPVDGETIRLTFDQDLLPESGFSPGVEDLNAYGFTTSYVVPLTLLDVTHPVGTDNVVDLTVQGMTSALYNIEVSPATAIDYDSTFLPDTATEFTGTEIGVGTSAIGVVGDSALLLTSPFGSIYGWQFSDTSGRVLPGSTYRVDIEFDVTAAVTAPTLYDAVFGTFLVSDGAVEVSITLTRVAGVFGMDIVSGGFSQTVLADWSAGRVTLSLLRNQKSDHYSVLLDGVPLVSGPTASFTGTPTISAGCRFYLSPLYGVTAFPIYGVSFTSTQTVFSALWNFLHGVSSSTVGSAALTKDHVLTERGPLVKGWGDATPATEQDVEVRVNGTAVPVDRVNPYSGKIYPEIPIPLMPSGSLTVEVDYTWFPSPAMAITGLNTEGLVLNKWDRATGHTYPPRDSLTDGVADTQRFPMGLVLGPVEREQPVLISHRYIGFEQEYTSALNSPTTLLLNQDPHLIAKQGLSRTLEAESVSYDGTADPQESSPDWTLEGVDLGGAGDEGVWQVIDASSGTFGSGTAAVYYRDVDLSFPSMVTGAARFSVNTTTPDGVFTGVGFGFHDNYRLYLLGALLVNDVKHVGLLTDPTRPHVAESWQIGPSVDVTITSENTFGVDAGEFPTKIEDGTRFQILDGPQAGVYTVAECGIKEDADGTVTVTIEETFPEDPAGYGNDTATVYFEVLWDDGFSTYRVVLDPDSRYADFFLGGELSGLIGTLEDAPAIPAETSLLIPTGEFGRAFWGSLSRIAVNSTDWTLFRYDVLPDVTSQTTQGIIVAAEMSDPPDEDANNEWFITNEFGYGQVSTSDELLLKSTSGSESLDLTYGYGRIEAFLIPPVAIDVDATFQVDTGTAGAGDAQILVRDTNREILFSTLLYRVSGSTKSLLDLEQASLSGLFTPVNQGWEESTGNGVSAAVRQNILTLTQGLGEAGSFYTDLVPFDGSLPSGGRVIEARARIVSWSSNASGSIGAYLGASVGALAPARTVAFTFLDEVGTLPRRVALTSDGVTMVATFPFDWGDGEFHSYRVVADSVTATGTVVVDDVVLGTVDLTLFDAAPDDTSVFIGGFGTDVVSAVEYDSFAVSVLAPPSAKRTIGVWLGGDPDDINNWKIPRTDGTDALNSAPGAIIEEMDWRSPIQVRVRKDPQWGVLVYRPDLAPPPYFTGDFATAISEPSAAWINVETRDLPRKAQTLGQVQFGALDPWSVTQQRWDEVRYRIYVHATEDLIAPQHMVLNRYNVINSGEYNFDVTPEVVQVQSATSTLVSLRPAHINADRVFNVTVDGTVLSPLDYSFDKETQVVTLDDPLPSSHYPVTVTFAPGKPVTNTYLCAQPLLDGVTKLNEGTPPFPLSQTSEATREVVFGSKLNDPNDLLNDDPDFILNDPYRTVEFTDDPNVLYENLEFCEVRDGSEGLLTIACDGVAPEEGWIELALDGTPGAYHDSFEVTGGPHYQPGTPSIKNTALFPQTSILHASGGGFVDGVLGPGTAVLYPNAGSANVKPGTGIGGLNQEIQQFAILNVRNVFTSISPDVEQALEDTYSFPAEADNTPPTSAFPVESNPDGTPGSTGNGAVAAHLEDAAGTYSRLGPWGGITSLEPNSLLAGASAIQPTGFPASGVALTLVGGDPLPLPTQTNLVIEAAN